MSAQDPSTKVSTFVGPWPPLNRLFSCDISLTGTNLTVAFKASPLGGNGKHIESIALVIWRTLSPGGEVSRRSCNRGTCRQWDLLAGAVGFEPTNGGSKGRCLTTWRRPIIGHQRVSFAPALETWLPRDHGSYRFSKSPDSGTPPYEGGRSDQTDPVVSLTQSSESMI